MVSYIKFLRFVKEQLPEYLPDEYQNVNIEVSRANKRMGKSYDGIQVYENDSSVGVSYDLHHYYSAMDDMSEMPSILQLIANEVVCALEDKPPSLADMLNKTEYIKEHLILDVVNGVNNEHKLNDIPHKLFGDIAVIYRMFYVDPSGEMYSTVVTDSIKDEIGFDDDQLFELAAHNTQELFPMEIMSLNGGEIKPQPGKKEIHDKDGELLDNKDIDPICTASGHGAECFFYPDFVRDIKRIFPDSFFILAISTVELIIIRDLGRISMDFINETALRIYVDQVPLNLRLTKKVYYYDDDTDTVGPVENYAHKMLQV